MSTVLIWRVIASVAKQSFLKPRLPRARSGARNDKFILCLLYLFLSACGAAEHFSPGPNPAAAPDAPPPVGIYIGVYVDSTAESWLRDQFNSVKACAGFERGSFEDLTVVIMPPTFPCPYYPDGCNGEFVSPATIKMGSAYIFRHEVIHYLLYRNTGDADPEHRSDLFEKCG